ncbi:hypothetical protein [Actinomadura rifamycini]|uniref:hypothetical protein n=1 Tax=Actinomadura rifamycini TaxID=31962 RepID=UPI0012FC703E|nr:hypothetical protein [Actinomadura rifamycini]
MAIIFELVINYGLNKRAANEAADLVEAHPALPVGPHLIPLHKPLLGTVSDTAGHPYLAMSVIPARVGWGVPLDRGSPHLPLTATELTELATNLYELLATLTDYQAAIVGWDPESLVDPLELRQHWSEELATGELPGLVVANHIHLPPTTTFERFTDTHKWIPYKGSTP